MSKILFISGSLSENSKSLLLLSEAMKIARQKGIETELLDLKNETIPFCDGRPFDGYLPSLKIIYEKIQQADFIVFGMPIYCYSISGPLKNFIDIFSEAFENKRFGICASTGSRRAYLATADLIKVMSFECSAACVQPLVLTDHEDYANGKITHSDVLSRIERMIESLIS